MIDNMISKKQLEQLIAEEYTKNDPVHKMQPKVSVSLLAYNHGAFIAQALDSILSQQVNFDYEIVIGEDCSQDNTREIVLSYQKNNPNKVRVFLSDKPLNDGKSGRLNFVRNLKSCRGEYVALLDGDDYWTSPYKLQRQADFLDNHPECSICFHSVVEIFEFGNREKEFFHPPNKRKLYTIEDLLESNFIATCSAMFRNGLIGRFPEWYFRIPMGDWPLHILNSQYGKIGYLDEMMGVYRIHHGGRWITAGKIKNCLDEIRGYRFLYNYLGQKHRKLIKLQISRRYYSLAKEYELQQHKGAALTNFLRCFLANPADPTVPHLQLMKEMAQCACQRCFGGLSSLKKQLLRKVD
jgi:glycosyltransferase involved in cell wall biosynthesis